MTQPTHPKPAAKPADKTREDAMLDESLDETFPASDPVQPHTHEKLPPADAPGSDVDDRRR